MIKIYHNPRCSKSRAGLAHLKEKGNDFEVIEYLKNPIQENELKDVLVKLNANPHDMIRTHEDIYRKQFKGKNFTDDEWIKIMIENPKLIKRPIVVAKYKAIWAIPPEEMDELL